MKFTTAENAALQPYLDRLHEDDRDSILGQFRHLAHVARDKRLTGKPTPMPIPGDSDWHEWRGDLLAAGAIVARIRDRDITDEAARAYAQVYVDATDAVRRIYLPDADDRCPALDQLDALEADRETDPAKAW